MKALASRIATRGTRNPAAANCSALYTCGCTAVTEERRWSTHRWPTVPVAPRIPTLMGCEGAILIV